MEQLLTDEELRKPPYNWASSRWAIRDIYEASRKEDRALIQVLVNALAKVRKMAADGAEIAGAEGLSWACNDFDDIEAAPDAALAQAEEKGIVPTT